jgi:hypothetical protein
MLEPNRENRQFFLIIKNWQQEYKKNILANLAKKRQT